MGYTFAVDQANFPEFRDLVLPHVADPRKRAALAQEFPVCRPIQEKDGEPIATHQPTPTQPLQIVLARVSTNARASELQRRARSSRAGMTPTTPTGALQRHNYH